MGLHVYPTTLYPHPGLGRQPEGGSFGCQFCGWSPVMTPLWHKHKQQVAAAGCMPVCKDQTRVINQGRRAPVTMLSCESMGQLHSNQKRHAACQQIGGIRHTTSGASTKSKHAVTCDCATAAQSPLPRPVGAACTIGMLPLPLANATQGTDERLLAQRCTAQHNRTAVTHSLRTSTTQQLHSAPLQRSPSPAPTHP